MTDIDDLTEGLSPDEKQQWQQQFAPQLQQAQQPQAPIVQAPPDNYVAPQPNFNQIAADQHAWDQQRSFGQNIPPPAPNYPPLSQQPLPRSTDIDDLRNYANQMSQPDTRAPVFAPARAQPAPGSSMRQLQPLPDDLSDTRRDSANTFASPGNAMGYGIGDEPLTTDRDTWRQEANADRPTDEREVARQIEVEKAARRAAQAAYESEKLKADKARAAAAKAPTEAKKKEDEARAARDSRAADVGGYGLDAVQKPELALTNNMFPDPYELGRARATGNALVPANDMFPDPYELGRAHAMVNFAVPGYDDAARDPTNPTNDIRYVPKDPYAQLRSSQVKPGYVDPLQAQMQAEKAKQQADVGPALTPEADAAQLKATGDASYAAEQARAENADADTDTGRPSAQLRQGTSGPAFRVRPGMVDPDTGVVAGSANEPDRQQQYTPTTVIPGKRMPAAWNVAEANPVSEEDQGRLAEADAARQGAVEAGREAGVTAAEANVADLQQRQKAITDMDAINRQRQLEHQQATRNEMDKLGTMVNEIRNRKTDIEPFLLPGAAGKFFNAIGQAIGAGAAARLGTKNFAAEYTQNAINGILAKQKIQAENDRNKLDAQDNLVSHMRKQYGDEELGDQAAKIALIERAKLHSDEVAQTSSVPRINANAAALSSDLGRDAVKETIAFNQLAQDKVTRRDIMTKPQVFGGQPIGGTGEGEEADSEKVVRLGDYSLAGHPANTDLVLQSKTDRKEAASVISAHSAIMSALNDIEALGKDPQVYNPYSATHRAYMKKVETITTLQGELRGQQRMPNSAELDKMYVHWDVGPTNLIGGASVEERADVARAEADRIASAKIKTFAPNIAERGMGVNERGQLRPVETYTGGTIYTHPMPKGFSPTPNTTRVPVRKDIAPLDMSHPKAHHITTRTSKGGKRSEDIGPAEDDGGDEGEND